MKKRRIHVLSSEWAQQLRSCARKRTAWGRQTVEKHRAAYIENWLFLYCNDSDQ